MSTHNLCFGAKIRRNVYPCKPQIYYIKVGSKGVFITRTCFPNVISISRCAAYKHLYFSHMKKKVFSQRGSDILYIRL